MNSFAITGRLARDPENNNGAVKFTVAVDDYDSATKQKTAQFLPCVAFGTLGQTIMQYAQKGREVGVTGRMHLNQWQGQNGEKRERMEFIANNVDLMGSPRQSGQGSQPTGNARNAQPRREDDDPISHGGFDLGDD